jgi:membrane protein
VGITTLLFAMIYKLMPTASIDWRDVWTGAFVTAMLFEVGKTAIGIYIGKSGVAESFAAAGSLVVLLAWVYYAAQVFLLGAEFTKVYADEHGSGAGRRAVASTSAGAGAADTGTNSAPSMHAGAKQIDAVRLSTARENQRHVERLLRKTSETLARQVALLLLTALANAWATRWKRRQGSIARPSHPGRKHGL